MNPRTVDSEPTSCRSVDSISPTNGSLLSASVSGCKPWTWSMLHRHFVSAIVHAYFTTRRLR